MFFQGAPLFRKAVKEGCNARGCTLVAGTSYQSWRIVTIQSGIANKYEAPGQPAGARTAAAQTRVRVLRARTPRDLPSARQPPTEFTMNTARQHTPLIGEQLPTPLFSPCRTPAAHASPASARNSLSRRRKRASSASSNARSGTASSTCLGRGGRDGQTNE